MMSPKCEDCSSAGGGGANSAGEGTTNERVQQTGAQQWKERERECAPEKEMGREAATRKKRQTESARAQREHMD
jgi:hypothetical protein